MGTRLFRELSRGFRTSTESLWQSKLGRNPDALGLPIGIYQAVRGDARVGHSHGGDSIRDVVGIEPYAPRSTLRSTPANVWTGMTPPGLASRLRYALFGVAERERFELSMGQ